MNFTVCWNIVAGGGIKQFNLIKKQKEKVIKMKQIRNFTLSKYNIKAWEFVGI